MQILAINRTLIAWQPQPQQASSLLYGGYGDMNMKIERPRFELTRVYEDGTKDEPEIVPVTQMPWDTRMNRRGFLGVGVGVASLLAVVDGCNLSTSQSLQPVSIIEAPSMPTSVNKGSEKLLKAHKSTVTDLVVTPQGKSMVSSSSDKAIKLWSLPDGKLLKTFSEPTVSVNALVITPDGNTLASGSGDGIIKLRSLPDGKLIATLTEHKGFVADLTVSPDGKILVSGSDASTNFWALPEGQFLKTGRGSTAKSLAITPNGKTLVSGKILRDFPDDKETNKLQCEDRGKLLPTAEAISVAITPDGAMLALGSRDYNISLWSLPQRQCLAILKGHKGEVSSLTITADGQTLASASADSTIKLWSLPDGKFLATLEGHKTEVNSLAVTPDGKMLISGDSAGVIILWNWVERKIHSFLFDRAVNESKQKGITYNVYNKITGQTLTYTLPCGSPIPPGAVCTCNCVPGTYSIPKPPAPRRSSGGGSYTVCTCNKICTCIPVPSDRDVKEAFETTDPLTILQQLSELPIQKWQYKWDDASIRHIGPMAQEFAKAFAVGVDDKHIHPVDAQGVAFAAIQGLYNIIKEKDAQTAALQEQITQQQKENQTLSARVEALEGLLKHLVAKSAANTP